MVLDVLSEPLFDPLDQLDLIALSLNMVMLLELASAKCISDIHADNHAGKPITYAISTG